MNRWTARRARRSLRWAWFFVTTGALAATFDAVMATVDGDAVVAQLWATVVVAGVTAQTVWSSIYREHIREKEQQEK